jgi:hypothetical protein
MNGSGATTIGSGGSLVISGAVLKFFGQRTINNDGTANLSGGDIYSGSGATFNNQAGGVFDVQGDANFLDNQGGPATFNNAGTFKKSRGTGTTSITAAFNNSGELDAQSGVIALQGANSLANGTKMSFGLGGSAGNGSISLSGAASFAGSLSVNLNGFFWPAAGSSFNLLNYTSETGVLFTNTTLPAPGYLTWQTNYNATAFALSVIAHTATNIVSTNLHVSTLNGTNILLQWPGDHTGWRVQGQTNSLLVGINTNWATVSGSSVTNQLVMPVGKTNGVVFFRMIYP